MKKKLRPIFGGITCFFLVYGLLSGCQKTVYHTVNKPAYIRVFNDLNYTVTLDNKDAPQPFLTFLIDPVINNSGVVTGAATIGDFLDERQPYAPAYPAHAGNTTFKNPEYPGELNVLVGPILNGIDLSSWAQTPSGSHRVMFISRPITDVPFLSLDPATRSTKDKILVDTTINFGVGDVYTMEVLNRTYNSNQASLYIRNEQFTNLAFSDSSVYVNFYNLSSKGYYQNIGINPSSGNYSPSIKDTMNVYLSLDSASNNNGTSIDGQPDPDNDVALPGYNGIYMGQVIRNTNSGIINPYASFPLFAQLRTNHITTNIYEYIELFAPGNDPNRGGAETFQYTFPGYLGLTCAGNNYTSSGFNGFNGYDVPNLIVTTASGQFDPESFGTINSIEIVNGSVYLMTIQRKFAPPVIR
jgi:hypothetical protein